MVDVVAEAKDGRKFLVSLKWQQTSGTAEQKVPFEVICLVEAVRASNGIFHCAYLVLGGEGWKLRQFFINELDNYLAHRDYVQILSFEGFIAKANKGQL